MYISEIPNFEFDINKIIEEYKFIESTEPFSYKKPSKRLHLVRTGIVNYTVLNKLPYTNEIIDKVQRLINIRFNFITYRLIESYSAYAWHTDTYNLGDTYHIPIITNNKCEFVYINNIRYKMPIGKLYKAKVDIPHTFENNSSINRVHLTFEVSSGDTRGTFTPTTSN